MKTFIFIFREGMKTSSFGYLKVLQADGGISIVVYCYSL